MFSVEVYAKVRRAVLVDWMTRREAARIFGVHRNTISKMLAYPVPPGYRRKAPRVSVKLAGCTEHIDAMIEGDRAMGAKQRHTAKRMFERLRDEHGYTGGLTIVHEYVRGKKRRLQEVFVPLTHRPGHAQADFGLKIIKGGGSAGRPTGQDLLSVHRHSPFGRMLCEGLSGRGGRGLVRWPRRCV